MMFKTMHTRHFYIFFTEVELIDGVGLIHINKFTFFFHVNL